MSEHERIEIRPDGEVRSSGMCVGRIALDPGFHIIGFHGEWVKPARPDPGGVSEENRRLRRELSALRAKHREKAPA